MDIPGPTTIGAKAVTKERKQREGSGIGWGGCQGSSVGQEERLQAVST